MNEDFYLQNSRINMLILTSVLAGIIFLSFIPLVSESIPESSPDFEKFADSNIKKHAEMKENVTMTQYYSINSMTERQNSGINELSGEVKKLNMILWIGMILSILIFIGLLLHTTSRINKIAIIFLYIGSLVLILSLSSIFLEIVFMQSVGNHNNISLASIGDTNFPIKYFHIIILFSIISIISSTLYVKQIISYVLRNKKQTEPPHSIIK